MFAQTRLRSARICVLAVYWPVFAFGQTDLAPPEPPLPPAQSTPMTLGQAEQQLQRRLQEFQASVAEVYKQDPKLASQMVHDFGNAANLIQSRVHSMSANKSHQLSDLPRFAVAAKEIASLRELGDQETAERLESRLKRLRAALENEGKELPASTQPEVHRVQLASGTTLPPRLRTKKNRLNKSYAEIHLQRTNAPIILILESRAPILWDVQAAQGVEVFAVIVESLRTQSVIGLENVLLLDTESAITQQLLDFRTLGSNSRGELMAGSDAETSQSVSQYLAPIVVGPGDTRWLREFVARRTEQIIDAGRLRRRQLQAEQLPELRYQASVPIRIDSNQIQYSEGECNVIGPIAHTLVPYQERSIRQTVQVPDDDRSILFAITSGGTLVTVNEQVKPQSNRAAPVPLDSSIFGPRARIRSMAYDRKRHRLICTPIGNQGLIAALDVESGEWSELGRLPHPLVGVAFAQDADELWAVAATHAPASSEETWGSGRLLRLDSDAKLISSQAISRPLLDVSTSQSAGMQASRFLNQSFELVAASPYAILAGLRPIGDVSSNELEGYHFIIDIRTGEMLYEGPQQLNDGTGAPLKRSTQSVFSAMSDLRAMLAECDSKMESAKLATGDRERLRDRVIAVKQLINGVDPPRERPRVYVVGRYSNNSAVHLHVTDNSGPVVLVLSGNQQVQWHVTCEEDVDLQKIVVDSLTKPTISAPKDIPVKVHTGAAALRILHENRHLNPKLLAAYVEEQTSLQPAAVTVLTSRQSVPTTLTIAPEGALRLKLATHELKTIMAELEEPRLSRVINEIEKQAFFALHRGRLPGVAAEAELNRTQHVFWNEFTTRGPKIGRSVPTHRSTAFACRNTQSGQLYCADLYRLYISSPDSEQTETINLRQIARSMGRITGLHYDEVSGQLWIDTQTGLWEFNTVTKKPTLRQTKSGRSSISTTYSPDHQRWYSLEQERRQNREVTRLKIYNQHYAFLNELELSEPLSRGLRSFSSSYPPQIKVLDDHVVVIDYLQKSTAQRVNGRTVSKLSFSSSIAIVEIATGRVIYRGGLTPHIEHQELSTAQLQSLWNKLRTVGDRDAEPLMWQLAAGGDKARKFLVSQYAPMDAAVEIDIAALVQRLDDNRFSIRESAYGELKEVGSKVSDSLQRIVDQGDISAEVRERITTLIRQWDQGIPHNDIQLQQIRGIEAIYRIGSKESKLALKEISGADFEAHIRLQAARSMNGESVPSQGFRNPAVQLQRGLFVPRVAQ